MKKFMDSNIGIVLKSFVMAVLLMVAIFGFQRKKDTHPYQAPWTKVQVFEDQYWILYKFKKHGESDWIYYNKETKQFFVVD